jgi:hypothetical protein
MQTPTGTVKINSQTETIGPGINTPNIMTNPHSLRLTHNTEDFYNKNGSSIVTSGPMLKASVLDNLQSFAAQN